MIGIRRLQQLGHVDNVYDYEVRINSDLICNFRHRYGDGLAECLRRAATAVEDARSKPYTREDG